MKSAVLVFPGINRERDMARALKLASGQEAAMVWHAETALPKGTDPETVTLEQAVELIKAKAGTTPERPARKAAAKSSPANGSSAKSTTKKPAAKKAPAKKPTAKKAAKG